MEISKSKKEEQYEILVALMVTRMFLIEKEDVDILNVEEYFDSQEKEENDVLLAWEKYLHLLERDETYRAKHGEEDAELISDVLKNISIVLDIDIDKNHIIQGCHSVDYGKELDESYMTLQDEMMDLIQKRGFEL